jgi:hypothetical protein
LELAAHQDFAVVKRDDMFHEQFGAGSGVKSRIENNRGRNRRKMQPAIDANDSKKTRRAPAGQYVPRVHPISLDSS